MPKSSLTLSLPGSFFALLLGMLLWAGCAEPAGSDATTDAAASGESATHDTEAPGEATSALSSEDQALVDAQKICPVGGGPLGGMGTPVKVMVGDKPVFICCEHCREPLLEEPDKYMAKLKSAKTDSETPAKESPAKPADEAASTDADQS